MGLSSSEERGDFGEVYFRFYFLGLLALGLVAAFCLCGKDFFSFLILPVNWYTLLGSSWISNEAFEPDGDFTEHAALFFTCFGGTPEKVWLS